tara:strand:- start:8 stop:367 length:360 start_codon:yes stop_codon:yes gene_type:complete
MKVQENNRLTKSVGKFLFEELSKTKRDYTGNIKIIDGKPQLKIKFIEPIQFADGVWCITGCTYAEVNTYINSYTGESRKVPMMAFSKIELHDNQNNKVKLDDNDLENIHKILESTTKLI